MIFVDTSAWAAFFRATDSRHAAAVDWDRQNKEQLVTSDYVVDELLTLIKSRFSPRAAIQAGESLWSEAACRLVYLTPEDIQAAWKIFQSHRDKGWSFTDCSSFALMQRLRISTSFAFDRHFSQMRGIRRVPA